jgi:acetyltransferase-like isoleucine patch superfamily enzyme
MGFLKKIVKKVVYKIFTVAQTAYNDEVIAANAKKATIGKGTKITKEASISNYLNDKEKIVIGKDCTIFGQLVLYAHGGEILIGDYCYIGPDSKIWSAKKISIGNRVLIAHNVNIHDNISHSLNAAERHEDYLHIFSTGLLQESNDLREKEVTIGDDVWIGFNATILKGVKIGKGAIIGANAVVTKDVPEFAVIVGSPQQIMKYTD